LIVAADTKLDFPLQDGSTKRKHLISIAKQSGKIPQELVDVPDVPETGRYIKGVFDSLSITRTWINGSPQQISQADIYYWCKLRDVKLSQIHLFAIQRLDVSQVNSYIECINERRA